MIAEKANLRLYVCPMASSVCTMIVTRERTKGRQFPNSSVLPSWSYYEARVNVYLQLRIMLVQQFLVHLKYAVHYGIANACQSGLKSLKIIWLEATKANPPQDDEVIAHAAPMGKYSKERKRNKKEGISIMMTQLALQHMACINWKREKPPGRKLQINLPRMHSSNVMTAQISPWACFLKLWMEMSCATEMPNPFSGSCWGLLVDCSE
jgi:hypothetical protein